MRILIACEESQATTKAFRERGFDAYSCDIKPCTGGNPEWHIQGDALKEAYSGKYDMMIAHPPCTYLAVSGASWLYNKDGTKNKERWANRRTALDFVRNLMAAPIKRIAIENPVSCISSEIRPPDCIVHPWMFGDEATKATCFWLKNLPALIPTKIVSKGDFYEWTDKNGKKKRQSQWYWDAFLNAKTPEERRTLRSKTFLGMANAMADQWGKALTNHPIQLNLFEDV